MVDMPLARETRAAGTSRCGRGDARLTMERSVHRVLQRRLQSVATALLTRHGPRWMDTMTPVQQSRSLQLIIGTAGQLPALTFAKVNI
jgi:hypothetical protein